MTPTLESLGIDRLTVEERLELIERIHESIDRDRPAGLTDDAKAELKRRDAEMDANPGLMLTWEQLVARVKGVNP